MFSIEKYSKTVYASSANFSGNRGRQVPAWVIIRTDKDGKEFCAVTGRKIRRSAMNNDVLVGSHGGAYDFSRKRDAKNWLLTRAT